MFLRVGETFSAHIIDFTGDGRNVLLALDSCRSHMSLKVMKYLDENGVIVYALPMHSSGKLQPSKVKYLVHSKEFSMKLFVK